MGAVIDLPWASGQMVGPCPECGNPVVWTENDVLLDWPSVAYHELDASWTVTRLTNLPWPLRLTRRVMLVAARGNPPAGANPKGHSLHDHQPPGSPIRSGYDGRVPGLPAA